MASSETSDSLQRPSSGHDWSFAWKGLGNIVSVPAVVLLSMFIGYGGIAREAGLTLFQTAISVPAIWALPSNMILVTGIVSGASLIAIALAVALASLRMFPMTVAWIPEVRGPSTRRWQLYAASSLVAVTAWVHQMQTARTLPAEGRLPYFLGFGCALLTGATVISMVTWTVATRLPLPLLAGLTFLTPLYFAISLWRAARVKAENLAMALGFLLCPVVAIWLPESGILIGGLAGGTLAFVIFRLRRRS